MKIVTKELGEVVKLRLQALSAQLYSSPFVINSCLRKAGGAD